MHSEAEQMETTPTIEERVRRLEDINEIRKLKAMYCKLCDVGWEGGREVGAPRRLQEIFTEDGIWDTGPGGRYEGREAIRQSFAGFQLGVHLAINPLIEVDGDAATGEWHGLVPLIDPHGGAYWVCGKYFEEYARTPEGWRIKLSRFVAAFYAPYEDGWAKTRFPAALPR